MPYPTNSLILKPEDVDDLSGRVQSAMPPRVLVPFGSGTKTEQFNLPESYTVLSTERLNNVIEYTPEDMTITVQAGMTLARLADVLAENKQRLPLDPPSSSNSFNPPSTSDATVGGVLATNDSGPIRFGRGTARDMVIGMRIVLADGRVIKSGGKVVKNVAGYDLHKLMIGGFGSLGIIAEVTFKLTPMPQSRRLVVLKPPDAVVADKMLERIIRGSTRPTILDLINARAARTIDIDAPNGSLLLVVGYEETTEAVDWQCEQLEDEFAQDAMACTVEDSVRIYDALREWPARSAVWKFKATLPSGCITAFFHQCGWHPISLVARAGNGVVYGRTDEPLSPELRNDLLESTVRESGNLIYQNCPPEAVASRWGKPRGDAFLMAAVKNKFDPQHLFVNGPFAANGVLA